MSYRTERATSSAISVKFGVSSVIAIAIDNSETVMGLAAYSRQIKTLLPNSISSG
jgi:hypothetical protein